MSTNTPYRDGKTLLTASSPFVQAMNQQNRTVLNAPIGGQYGIAPNNFRFVNEHPHIEQNGYCFLLSTPTLFNKLPDPTFLHSLTKSLFENRSRTFEGLTSKITWDFADQTWGGGARLSVPVGATQQLGAVSHSLVEVEGEVYTNLIKIWGTYGLEDPKLLRPKAITLDDPGDLLIDSISCSAVYVTPTRDHKDVAHSALIVGIMPKDTPQIEIKKNQDTKSMRELNIEFTGLIEFDTYASYEIGLSFLKRLKPYNPDGRRAPAGFGQRTAILETLRDVGNIEQAAEQARTVVNPLFMG